MFYKYDLYYWESDGIAELDFLIQKGVEIIPIEVKSNIHTKARSLDLYMKNYSPKYAIRISEKNFGFENNIKSIFSNRRFYEENCSSINFTIAFV